MLKKRLSGFSLIELLIVIAVLGIISTAVVIATNPQKRTGQARDAIRKNDLAQIYNALVTYYAENDKYPTDSAGEDGVSSSLDSNWLEELVPNYLKNIPRDPRRAQSNSGDNIAGAVVPSKGKTYQMKVLVLNYMPTSGSNLNFSITGINSSVSAMRSKVSTIKNETLQALEDGSKYHKTGPVTMDYSIAAEREYLEALPVGLPLGGGVNRPDYRWILNRENICDWVNNQGVTEVWLFGYHYGNIAPAESNMAGPHGDISNSERTDDMPICSKTYVLYNYNYGRSSNEATHNHGHHIESVMAHVDQVTWDKFAGPWQTYSSSTGSASSPHRCGWTHSPPNAGNPQYIYNSMHTVWTDCEDWRPNGGGNAITVNCTRWECNERKFHIWRWQGLPGKDNTIVGVSNWWDFIGDFDTAMATNQKLIYDLTPPGVPANLSSSDIYDRRLTLNWSASTDDFAVSGYEIRRNGAVVGSSSATTFTDYTVSPSATYSYTVAAVDTSGNVSGESSALSVTTTDSVAPIFDRPIFDSASYKIGGPSARNYSFWHSVGNGQGRFLIVGVGLRHSNANSVTSVTWKGTPLTRLDFYDTGGLREEFWVLTSPTQGVGEITVNLAKQPAGGGTMAKATSWFFVDQDSPTGVVAKRQGFSNNPQITVSSTNQSVVVDIGSMPSAGLVATGWGTGQTKVLNNWYWGDTLVMGSYKNSSGVSTVMNWNAHHEAWALIGVSLNFDPATQIPPEEEEDPPEEEEDPPEDPPATPETVACPEVVGVYCYMVSQDTKNFVLWANLDNIEDEGLWYKVTAKCREVPPFPAYYNYCVKN